MGRHSPCPWRPAPTAPAGHSKGPRRPPAPPSAPAAPLQASGSLRPASPGGGNVGSAGLPRDNLSGYRMSDRTQRSGPSWAARAALPVGIAAPGGFRHKEKEQVQIRETPPFICTRRRPRNPLSLQELPPSSTNQCRLSWLRSLRRDVASRSNRWLPALPTPFAFFCLLLCKACTHTQVCTHVCRQICTHVCTQMCRQIRTQVWTHVCTQMCTYVCTHV